MSRLLLTAGLLLVSLITPSHLLAQDKPAAKAEDKKPDDKKPEDKKPEDKKPEDKKPEPPKPKETAPPIVDPGVPGTPDQNGKAPADAVVLFDGTNFDAWRGDKADEPVKWTLLADEKSMEISKGGGTLRTKDSFGFGQYHLEFRTPSEVKGSGQGRGNSGIYTLGGPEVQVLDSYNNETYFNGQCGSIYGFYAPLVNACRPPGVWQTYDILYLPPAIGEDGKATRPATMTVLHNGVLIHAQAEIKDIKDPKRKGPINLQDHGNPVRYRNIWYRPFPPAAEEKKPEEKKPDAKPADAK